MRFLVENYPYEVILPTFPEVSPCFEVLTFVTALTFVTYITVKHGRPLRKSRNHFIRVVFDEESHGDVPRSPFCWRQVVIYHNGIPYWTPDGPYPFRFYVLLDLLYKYNDQSSMSERLYNFSKSKRAY